MTTTEPALTSSDLRLLWAVNDPSLDRFPWQLSLPDRRVILLSADLGRTVVLPNGGDVYQPGGRHEVPPDQVPAAVLAAAHAALRRADGDELAAILRRTRRIARLWGVEDVRAVRPDLDADQAWDVLQAVDQTTDADTGISHRRLEDTAEALFGPVSGDEPTGG